MHYFGTGIFDEICLRLYNFGAQSFSWLHKLHLRVEEYKLSSGEVDLINQIEGL